MILSRARSTAAAQTEKTQRDSKPKVPELEELLQKRDYVGAVTLLEFRRLVSCILVFWLQTLSEESFFRSKIEHLGGLGVASLVCQPALKFFGCNPACSTFLLLVRGTSRLGGVLPNTEHP